MRLTINDDPHRSCAGSIYDPDRIEAVCGYLMPEMKAVVISHPGAPDVLTIEDRPQPPLGVSEVLIGVKAAG